MPDHGGFSFTDFAEELTNNIIQSLIVDMNVELDFAFGLDLGPTLKEYSTNRVPNRFIQVNHFEMWGGVGVNDWTSDLDLLGLDFKVAEAVAMLNISSTLSSSPLRLTTASQLADLVLPPNEESDRIIFQASLFADIPIFLTSGGIGVGSRIQYRQVNCIVTFFSITLPLINIKLLSF